MVNININSMVKIKLTRKGEDYILKQWKDTVLRIPSLKNIDRDELPKYLQMDNKGYIELSIWELMKQFGDKMGTGRELMFETNIFINEKDINST